MSKEGENMTRIMNSINNIDIPINIQKELGLSENWKKKISPKQVEKLYDSALKYKEALRKLSKN